MRPIRLLALLMLTLTSVSLSLSGCSAIEPSAQCDLTIVAGEPDGGVAEGEPVPAGSVVIVAPGEFDRTRSSLGPDEQGQLRLTLQITGDAIARLAGYTMTHVGETMIIGINGEVVSTPMINEAIQRGELSISPATDDARVFQTRFAGCVP
jgi:preprotein translocase subunit SecD